MPSEAESLTIVSRRSRLARVQAEHVGQLLRDAHPGLRIEFLWLVSEGDQKLNVPLWQEGGKGLFAGAIEEALIQKRADIAVHSLKDLPARDTDGLAVVATPQREDVRDALIAHSADSIEQLRPEAVVGTASPRRASQLKRQRPDLKTDLIRGNVETRLRKVLEDRQYDATLLAMAGLRRLGLNQHASRPIDLDIMLPAAGQGALALQCREDDTVARHCLAALNDPDTFDAITVERHIVAGLGCTCHSPVAVLAQPKGEATLHVRARVMAPDGEQQLAIDRTFERNEHLAAADAIVDDLKQQGSDQVLGLS